MARLKGKAGSAHQRLPFCRANGFRALVRALHLTPKPTGLGPLVKVTLQCSKRCIKELKQCVPHCAIDLSLFGSTYSHFWTVGVSQIDKGDRYRVKYLRQKNLRYVLRCFSGSPVLILSLSLFLNFLSSPSKMFFTPLKLEGN